MFKKILRESIKEVAHNYTLVRISFLTWFVHNLYFFVWLAWKINNVLHYRYEQTPDSMFFINQIVNVFLDFWMWGLLFVIWLIFFVWYIILYPIGVAMMVYQLDTHKVQRRKWFDSYFSVVVMSWILSLITFSGWHLSWMTWLFIMDIMNNILIQIVLGIFGLIILSSTLLFPFATYSLLLDDHGSDRPDTKARNALSNSAWLVSGHLWTTIKFSLLQMLLKLRFFINMVVVVGVPAWIAYLLITTNLIVYETALIIAMWIWIVLLLFIVYVDSLIDAFFMTFWYKLYKFLMWKELEEQQLAQTKK